MVHQNRRNFLAQTLAASGVLLGASAWAQNYPNRVIKMVVPFPPGGGGDMVGRLFAKKLSEALGVPVIVENKPGASSVIGTQLLPPIRWVAPASSVVNHPSIAGCEDAAGTRPA